jgi:hypothetical protein
MARLEKESGDQRKAREGREMTATKKRCPGKKGPAVYIWEDDNGVWTRTLLTRGEVDGYWGQYGSSQKIFNAIDNCWDLCLEFDKGTVGEVEDTYDSNDSDNDIPPQVDKQSQRPPSPKNGRPGDAPDHPPMVVDPTPHPQAVPTPAQVTSDCAPMVVDPPPTCPPMVVDSTPHPVLTPAQVVSDCPPIIVDPTPHSVPTPAQVASDPPPHSC